MTEKINPLLLPTGRHQSCWESFGETMLLLKWFLTLSNQLLPKLTETSDQPCISANSSGWQAVVDEWFFYSTTTTCTRKLHDQVAHRHRRWEAKNELWLEVVVRGYDALTTTSNATPAGPTLCEEEERTKIDLTRMWTAQMPWQLLTRTALSTANPKRYAQAAWNLRRKKR